MSEHCRTAVALLVYIVAGCCPERSAPIPSETPAASASAPQSARDDTPSSLLLGTWRYEEPRPDVLAMLERRSKSVSERDQRLSAARELVRITKTYTADRRSTRFGGAKPRVESYEVVKTEGMTITLRLSPAEGREYEETLVFLGEDRMREIVEGLPYELVRQ